MSSTITVTVDDSTVTTPAKRALEARATTVIPSAIPTYATTACINVSEYASACSCYGITGSITTAPTPTVTVTTTIDFCDDL
jgi:hypothetical protein